jgi:hypothetical protein
MMTQYLCLKHQSPVGALRRQRDVYLSQLAAYDHRLRDRSAQQLHFGDKYLCQVFMTFAVPTDELVFVGFRCQLIFESFLIPQQRENTTKHQ